MDLRKITDHEDLVKDRESGAILLSNQGKANEYLLRKKAINDSKQMAQEINSVREKLGEIDELKSELGEIKRLLQLIVKDNG